MQSVTQFILVGLFLSSLTAHAQQACHSVFINSKLVNLAFRQDSETKQALDAIRNSQYQESNARSALYKGEAYDQSKLTQAHNEAKSILQMYFKNDPTLIGLPTKDIELISEKTLNWRITTDNQTTSTRASLEIGRNYLYLKKIQQTEKPKSWENVLRQANIPYVSHGTTLENLTQILQQLKITPRPSDKHINMGGDPDYVYVEIPDAKTQSLRPTLEKDATDGFYKYTMKELLSEKGAYILISPSVVDNTKWSHVNSYWEYGKLDPKFSFKTPIEIMSLLKFLKENNTREESHLLRELFHPEWLFTEAIDLQKNDFRILVHAKVKDSFKSKLAELGIDKRIIDRIE